MLLLISGCKIEQVPKINAMLNMFEPIILPIAISDFFLNAAVTEETNSGIEVPQDIIVNDINDSETFKFLAILTDESINKSQFIINSANPIIIHNIVLTNDCFL